MVQNIKNEGFPIQEQSFNETVTSLDLLQEIKMQEADNLCQ